MNALLLIVVPLAGAALAAAWPGERTRPWLLPVVGVVHTFVAFWLLVNPPAIAPDIFSFTATPTLCAMSSFSAGS